VILVDTAVWIDHLHKGEPQLVELLDSDQIGSHPLIVEEIALGSLRRREVVLDLLGNLFRFPTVAHDEVLHLTEEHRLWGRGLSAIDVHLMAAVALVPGSRLWTRDRRLRTVCSDTGVAVFGA